MYWAQHNSSVRKLVRDEQDFQCLNFLKQFYYINWSEKIILVSPTQKIGKINIHEHEEAN